MGWALESEEFDAAKRVFTRQHSPIDTGVELDGCVGNKKIVIIGISLFIAHTRRTA